MIPGKTKARLKFSGGDAGGGLESVTSRIISCGGKPRDYYILVLDLYL